MTVDAFGPSGTLSMLFGPVEARITRPGPVRASILTSQRLNFQLGRLGSSSAPAATGTTVTGAEVFARHHRPGGGSIGQISGAATSPGRMTMTPGPRDTYILDATGNYGGRASTHPSVRVLKSRVQVSAAQVMFVKAVREAVAK